MSNKFMKGDEIMLENIKSNEELEILLGKNQEQLETMKNEMNLLLFSISHDLKAPLRAIEGYSKIIQMDYASELDPEVQSFMNSIQRNANKMCTLIDDLITLSKINLKELNLEMINLNLLVQEVFDQLHSNELDRSVLFTVSQLPIIQGDILLLRQFFQAILSNALKFTASRKDTSIEVGCESKENEHIFFIKDNGVGFDMKYSTKLFRIFQKMHTEAQFSGNGIGLALSERIITKHGGKVWIKGEFEEGTTLYFSIPCNN